MPFSENIKLIAKQKSNFQCVLCNSPLVEVHHIDPESEGGSNDLENAAPLCPGCHGKYGGNPDFRKQIREARDHWWKVVEHKNQFFPGISVYSKIDEMQTDLKEVKGFLINYYSGIANSFKKAISSEEIIGTVSSAASGILPDGFKSPESNE